MAGLGLLLLVVATAGWWPCAQARAEAASLPPPCSLLVNHLKSPAVVGSLRPRFHFTACLHRPSALADRGLAVSSIAVRLWLGSGPSAGQLIWASGNVSWSGGGPSIQCGAVLQPATTYRWTASWIASDGRQSPEAPAVLFDTGILSQAGWRGARWVGGGHREFKTSFIIPEGSTKVRSTLFGRAFISAPGGGVLRVNGRPVGSDTVGMAPWLDFTAATHHRVLRLDKLLQTGLNDVVLTIGCGAWCPSEAPTWNHSGRAIYTAAGREPVARMLVLVEHPRGELYAATGMGNFSSRLGTVPNSSSWYGATHDWTLAPTAGWTSPARLVPDRTVALDIPAADRVFSMPPTVTTFGNEPGSVQSTSPDRTQPGTRRWLYTFENMTVGSAAIKSTAWSGQGVITLEYCETLWNGECVRQHGFEATGTKDIHKVNAASGHNLSTSLSWRGFRYVFVSVTSGVSFRAAPGDLQTVWASMAFESTASISFTGGNPGDASLLSRIDSMVRRGLASNIVSGSPTDCPTREKHGWLGDAADAAGAVLYLFRAAPLYSLFLEMIVDGQANASAARPHDGGYVPSVVPCHGGVDAAANDLSWTTGFPLITKWLLQHTGDVTIMKRSWPALAKWCDGQLANASAQNLPGGLPDWTKWGDPAAIRGPHGEKSNPTVAASANFLGALGALVDMAHVMNDDEGVQRWTETLRRLKSAFVEQYWQSSLGTFAPGPGNMSVQTVSPLAVAAAVGTPIQQQTTMEFMLRDIMQRNFSLTIGNVGAKRILTSLSAMGADGHDAALRLALRTAYPSWGFWIHSGASTCWEAWNNETVRGADHYHGSLNHGWLCGGVGEWLYSALGGVTAETDGFQAITFAPKISATLGPSGVAVEVDTPCGLVQANWTRVDNAIVDSQPGLLVEVCVVVPVSANATLVLPVLVAHTDDLAVIESIEGRAQWHENFPEQEHVIWRGSTVAEQSPGFPSPGHYLTKSASMKSSRAGITMSLPLVSGEYCFHVGRVAPLK